MTYSDFIATPQPLVYGQVITDPTANNGEPFIYREGGSDGMDTYLLKEIGPYASEFVDIIEPILPKYIYGIDKSFSYDRSSYLESFRDYYRRVREAERFVAFINWHVERMGEVWFVHICYDNRSSRVGDKVVQEMNIYDKRIINDGVYEFTWEEGVFYKFVNVERKRKSPEVM